MKELRIYGIYLAIDWREDREPTVDDLRCIITDSSGLLIRGDGSPLLTFHSDDDLSFEVMEEGE